MTSLTWSLTVEILTCSSSSCMTGTMRAPRILGNIRNAIIPGGRLVIIEAVMPPGDEYHHAKFLDVNMLVLSEGGRERTEEEYRTLLDGAGFTLTRVVPTAAPLSVVEAIPRRTG